MSHCSVTFSANAGYTLHLGRGRVWVDALHIDKVQGFSALTPERIRDMEACPAWQDPDLMVYTHCHPDHFSLPLLRSAIGLWPRALPILPEQRVPNQILLKAPEEIVRRAGLTLRFAPLTHDGTQFAKVPHYGCIISDGSYRVLLTGDSITAVPELADFIGGESIDLAILNFPWLTLPKGRRCIEEVIRPRHLLICHLPFPEDDCWGYLPATERSVARLPSVPDIRLLTRPLQEEHFD